MSARGAVVLIGFMGAGKTTAARELAATRGLHVSDVDQLIEARGVGTITEIFERDGEPAFRALEEEVVCELLAQSGEGEVIALSGGAIGSERVRAALAEHLVVWLDIEPALAWRRVGVRQPTAGARSRRLRRALRSAAADLRVAGRCGHSLDRARRAAARL